MSTAAVRRYWEHLVNLGCVVCGGPAEVAHCAGKPSVTERIKEPKPKGVKLSRHDWLVIPLCPWHHRYGRDALDIRPELFEELYGSCASHINRIGERLGVDPWALSQEGRK